MSGLKDKVVLVTGASSGIGEGTALHLASLGCRLSLVARNEKKLLEVQSQCKVAGSLDVVVFPLDLSIGENCVKAVENTVQHYGSKLTINQAGGYEQK